MIQALTSLDPCRSFIEELNADPNFSDPHLSSPGLLENNLQKALTKPNDHVWGVFTEDRLIGLFVFLILEDEQYIEMIVGLSREAAAYEEVCDHLQALYPGFRADFVFNPANAPLRELLIQKDAFFDEEQQKMVLSANHPSVDAQGVEALSVRYKDQYLAIHDIDPDRYWTGEKVIAAPERFNVFIAIDEGKVVGFIDVTNCFDENEPYDLQVLTEHRRKGWGRKLLAEAIETNEPHGMMLLVDVSNTPAIKLYDSMGFEKAEGQNSQTVNWYIPG